MDKALHRRIKIVSISAMILFTLAFFAGLILAARANYEDFVLANIVATWIGLLLLCVIAVVTSYSIINEEKRWIKKSAKYALYFFPVILILFLIVDVNSDNIFLLILTTIVFTILSVFALLRIFVFSDATASGSTIIFVGIIIIGIVLRRFHIAYSSIIFSVSLILFITGSFMYGIRCLYLAGKNLFLKYVGFFGSSFISLTFMGLMWKMQHWPGGDFFIKSSNVLMVLGTATVLLRLPSSGYINWQSLHKKILKRLILPWMFIFILFLMRFLLPEINSIVWSAEVKKPKNILNGFDMVDYKIENKNGLNME